MKKIVTALITIANLIAQTSVVAAPISIGRALEDTELAGENYIDTNSIKPRGKTRRFQRITTYDLQQTDTSEKFKYQQTVADFITNCDDGTLSDPIRAAYYDAQGRQVGNIEFGKPEFEIPTVEINEKTVDFVCSAKP